jgi:hypothetical protein
MLRRGAGDGVERGAFGLLRKRLRRVRVGLFELFGLFDGDEQRWGASCRLSIDSFESFGTVCFVGEHAGSERGDYRSAAGTEYEGAIENRSAALRCGDWHSLYFSMHFMRRPHHSIVDRPSLSEFSIQFTAGT